MMPLPRMDDTPVRYGRVRIALHWLIALLLFGAFPLGLYMHDLALTPTKIRLFNYHKWLGVSILLLALVRIVARIIDRTHDGPAATGWQRSAATLVHALLYVSIVVVPVSGWLMSSAEGFQTVWFGVIPLPDIVPRDKALAALLKVVHKGLNFAMLGLVTVHVLAALQHQFVLRDGVLGRMLPVLRR